MEHLQVYQGTIRPAHLYKSLKANPYTSFPCPQAPSTSPNAPPVRGKSLTRRALPSALPVLARLLLRQRCPSRLLPALWGLCWGFQVLCRKPDPTQCHDLPCVLTPLWLSPECQQEQTLPRLCVSRVPCPQRQRNMVEFLRHWLPFMAHRGPLGVRAHFLCVITVQHL